MLYTESDLEASMDKIETINFHEEKDVFGIKFWAYNAGHVLGAAMFMIEIAGVKVLAQALFTVLSSNWRVSDFVHGRLFAAGRSAFDGCRNSDSQTRRTYHCKLNCISNNGVGVLLSEIG